MIIRFYLPIDTSILAKAMKLPCDPPKGSGSLFMIPIFKRLLEDGYHISIVTVSDDCKEAFTYQDENVDIFIGVRRKKNLIRGLTFFKYEIDQMVAYAKKRKCDYSIALWSYEFALASERVHGADTVVVLHDWAPRIYDIYHDYYRFCRLLMSNHAIKKANYFICVSPYIQVELNKIRPECKSMIIPNAVEIDSASFMKASQKTLRTHQSKIVCANNSFFGLKNVDQSVRIFHKVLDKLPTAELHLYGKGNSKTDSCAQWLRENGLEKNVFLHGAVNHDVLMEAFLGADLFLHTSLEESFGLVYIEALLCGTPVFAERRAGAAKWILENGRIGRLIDSQEEEEVAIEIVSILTDNIKWDGMKNKGLDVCKKRFSVEKVYDEWLKALDSNTWK